MEKIQSLMEFLSRGISFFLLAIFLFFIIIISLLSVLFQKRPIFFLQERVGFKYRKFMIYKFRSMKKSSESLITLKNDSRITKWGKFLRLSKIDELPQLLNILKGEMRFVGPRPEVEDFVDSNFSFLNKIKPGLTDFSSIIFRNESSMILKAKDYNKILKMKTKLSIFYAERKSFNLDLYIIVLTLISIFFPATAQYFVINYVNKFKPDLSNELKSLINK